MSPSWSGISIAAKPARPDAGQERVKILLVDDQPENLLSAEAVLESLGQEIVKASSGREALRHLLDEDFAVILLDVMMPGMDGFETAELIRQRERSSSTPIIFVTALGKTDEHLFRGYGVGAVDYLYKPIVPEVLRSKVSVFIDLSKNTALLRRQAELLQRRNADLEAAVAERRQAEEKIAALNAHLEARIQELDGVNRELEAFTYSVSHDLRAPLARIAGFTRALLESYGQQLDEAGRTYLERAHASGERMSQLVEDLLNFSRLTRAEMHCEPADLSAVVRTIAQDLANRDAGREVDFAIEDGLQARADGGLIRAVLENLLENAWKFARHRPRARIEFGYNAAEGAYFVRDNGAGFDMALSGRLFHPFQRLHAASEFEGTGIGLAIVDRIIQRHGGRVWAVGEVDRGATFYFSLNCKEKT